MSRSVFTITDFFIIIFTMPIVIAKACFLKFFVKSRQKPLPIFLLDMLFVSLVLIPACYLYVIITASVLEFKLIIATCRGASVDEQMKIVKEILKCERL